MIQDNCGKFIPTMIDIVPKTSCQETWNQTDTQHKDRDQCHTDLVYYIVTKTLLPSQSTKYIL